ncbi:MAG TPA: hydantoinase/oxoprolinase family protein [Stellaceae bacterium]|jgi:N-methylhydantoinase A|nr:hydantoinase/oxoprolinase family protein [Stellaceae bacterium]
MTYRIGIDVGGTFTDLVAIDEAGGTALAKVPSTPEDPSLGVLDGLAELADRLGLRRAALLAETERIVHGTTVATNALLERKGAKLGLLTTEGHRDVIEMREGLKDDRYNLRMPPPEQLVPRPLRLGVRERIRADGRIETPLDPESLEDAIAILRTAQVEAVAVCYLHAWRDPRHEKATAAALARALPGTYVSLSSEVLPQIKEFERVSTTVVNAYVGPVLSRYLARLASRLVETGYRGPTLIMQSHGGIVPIAEAGRLAAGAVLSGPAGGAAGSVYAARLAASPDLIPFDMGGTSTDICLVVNGQAALVADRRVGGHRIALNSLDIASIGAGGGSIARVDAGGILHVGPASAGAVPGPACYGNDGTAATVTDANLVLGYLDPTTFLGGARTLDKPTAEAAIDRIAGALGVSRLEAARGIHRVVNTNMAEGVRLVSVRRGVDPRRFALFAFGGAAGLHATDIARQLDLRRVIVPRVAAVLSAWGMLATDLRFEVARSHVGDTGALDTATVKRLYDEMEAEGLTRLRASFAGPARTSRSADMRYGEQVFEVTVPLDDVDWTAADLLPQIAERFHDRHEALYTYSLPEQEAVLVNARVTVSGVLEELPQEPALPAAAPGPPQGRRRVYLDDWIEAPVYAFDFLAPGQSIPGPSIVESAMTTVLLRPDDTATVTDRGWLDVAIPARPGP